MISLLKQLKDPGRAAFGAYELFDPALLLKPADVPDDYIAYNPSSIHTVKGADGVARDIMYVRVEPNRSDAATSHLGKSVVRPYIINPRDLGVPLAPYYGATEYTGEDAALTRVNRKLPGGKLEKVWLFSYVDPQPEVGRPNRVQTLCTRFFAGADLNHLEHVADGPEWMKDIRVAPFIDESLLPIGGGTWGGVNDVIKVSAGKYILAAHRAWTVDPQGFARHYESVLYGHDVAAKSIIELGVLATSDMFPAGKAKDASDADLSDVVFTGGGYNGTLEFMSFGVRDGSVGVGRVRRV